MQLPRGCQEYTLNAAHMPVEDRTHVVRILCGVEEVSCTEVGLHEIYPVLYREVALCMAYRQLITEIYSKAKS